MPLYPYLQALFYHPDMNEQELFEQAKQFNLILSMILLVCLFLALLWLFGFFRSYLLILIIAFSLYIFKAPYVQAEILYYSLSALGFILMLVMLYRPTWLGAIATGIILGFAYLTKGTMLSSLPLFLLLYGIDLLIFALKKYESRFNEHLLFIARRAAYLLVVLVMFAVIIFPYAQALKQRFGHYFYNVNTTFYIWYDDWDVAKKEEAKHQFAKQWPAHLAADELPSLRKYVRDHTFRQILDRFRHGIGEIYEIIFFRPFSVTNYWISYLFILLMGILINLDNFRKFTSIYTIPLMFAILYFAGYLIAFSWYCPIACGRRFTFSLYIPFLIAVFMAIKELANIQSRKSVESQLNLTKFFTASNVIVGITLIYNIWLVTSEVIFFDFYDS